MAIQVCLWAVRLVLELMLRVEADIKQKKPQDLANASSLLVLFQWLLTADEAKKHQGVGIWLCSASPLEPQQC